MTQRIGIFTGNSRFSARSASVLMRYDGNSFRTEPLDGRRGTLLPEGVHDIYDIEGSGPQSLWVVGGSRSMNGFAPSDSSFLAHYDGSHWYAVDLDAGFVLFSVAASDDGAVFAGGNADHI